MWQGRGEGREGDAREEEGEGREVEIREGQVRKGPQCRKQSGLGRWWRHERHQEDDRAVGMSQEEEVEQEEEYRQGQAPRAK